LRAELSRAKEQTERPWGVGLITWSVDASVVDLVLSYRPHAVMLSFGDPRSHAIAIKAAGSRLVCQVQDLAGARLAVEAGADIIMAQGTEAGGHAGGRATLPLVPAVVDAVAPVPVVAAGGIADGRGLAAVLMLGAHGGLIGTRFYASEEALGHDRAKQRLVGANGDETARTTVFDTVRGLAWPASYAGRALRNHFMKRWHGREAELAAALSAERGKYQTAARDGDLETAVVWAGEAVDLIASVERAATLVQRISAQAEVQLIAGANLAARDRANRRECNLGLAHPSE
jgi:nitronate monooxygenase